MARPGAARATRPTWDLRAATVGVARRRPAAVWRCASGMALADVPRTDAVTVRIIGIRVLIIGIRVLIIGIRVLIIGIWVLIIGIRVGY